MLKGVAGLYMLEILLYLRRRRAGIAVKRVIIPAPTILERWEYYICLRERWEVGLAKIIETWEEYGIPAPKIVESWESY